MLPPINKTLAALTRLMRGAVNQQLEQLHIRAAHSDLLLYISDYPDQLQKDIARANYLDPSLLARDLQLLARRGWVEQRPDDVDKRARRVRLTPEGQSLAAHIKELTQRWWQDFAAANPTLDLEHFSQLANEVFLTLNEGDHNA